MKFSASDIAVSAAVLILSVLLGLLYVQERGRSSVRTDEEPLGTIVFKKLSATRRSESGLIWERMRNNGPVYVNDTLRTADASEASIYFDDGTNLDMFENSMLRLDFAGKERTFEFLGGDISVSGPAGERNADLTGLPASRRGAVASGGYTIKAGGKTISVSENSQASLSRTGDTLRVEVLQGEIGVTGSEGEKQTIGQANGLEVDLKSGSTRIVEISVFPLLPEQNARLLVERPGSATVEFSWESRGGAGGTLEISDNGDFDPLAVSARATTGNSISSDISPGTWFWRVRSPDGTLSSARRLTLYAESPPRPILPASGAEAFFRVKIPAVNFSWTEMPDATAYIFEIAGDRDFADPVVRNRTNMTGLTVDTLGEGTWYWRVSPAHPLTLLEKKTEPEVRAFSIRRRAGMTALDPTMPPADSLFIVQEAAGKGIAFSWVPDPEAVEYELSVGRSKDMSDAVFSRTLTKTWLTLSGPEASAFEKPATWYWAVRWKDAEGNVSPYSEPRSLQGIDGSIALRLSFPPDGYTIADSLIGNTRFAWKSRVPARTVFQLSEDESFSTVAFEEESDTETLIGRQWKTGIWYWRLRTFNTDGSVLHDTEPRMFRVVDPLPEPRLLSPTSAGEFHLRMEDPYTISWENVADADYYQFRLNYLPADGAEALRHGVAFMTDTKVELPFGAYPEGRYRILLQAFSLDKEMSTRIIGYLGKTEFVFKRIARMELASPAPNIVFVGLDARRHGIPLSWRVPDLPETSELLISKDPSGRAALLRRPGGTGKALLERLSAGDYYWTVKGELYGLDISALAVNKFTVLPIPPLPAPSGIRPANGFTFGPKELRDLTAFRFEWNAVPDATRYIFALFRGSDAVPMIRSDSLTGHSYALEDFTVLDAGEYRWTLQAQAYDAKGELEQDGIPVESRFRIDLPKIVAPELKSETFYGR
jgi:hypothetical protein